MLLSRSSVRGREIARRLRRLKLYPFFVLFSLTAMGSTLFLTDSWVRQVVRDTIYDFSAFALSIAEKPVADFTSIKTNIEHHLSIQKNANNLEAILGELRTLKNRADQLALENQELRDLLSLQSERSAAFMTVPCFGQYTSLNSDALFIRAGKTNGIARYDVVLSEETIVGQVEEVGAKTARILLITDPLSRIPVMCADSKEEGILKGDRKGGLKIIFAKRPEDIAIGERVYSSGVDGYFPRGKLVGVVSSINQETVQVKPVMDSKALRYVQVYKANPGVMK